MCNLPVFPHANQVNTIICPCISLFCTRKTVYYIALPHLHFHLTIYSRYLFISVHRYISHTFLQLYSSIILYSYTIVKISQFGYLHGFTRFHRVYSYRHLFKGKGYGIAREREYRRALEVRETSNVQRKKSLYLHKWPCCVTSLSY